VVERFTKAEFEAHYGRQILEFGADRAVHELSMQAAIRMKLNVSTGDTTEYLECSDAPPWVIKNVWFRMDRMVGCRSSIMTKMKPLGNIT